MRTATGSPNLEIAANCQTGETAVGGGVAPSNNREVISTYPNASDGGTPTGWIGRVAGNGAAPVTVYVLCAS